jgi:hypothetical protein
MKKYIKSMTPNTKATALQERRFNRPSNSPFWAKIRAQMKLHFPNPNLKFLFMLTPFSNAARSELSFPHKII